MAHVHDVSVSRVVLGQRHRKVRDVSSLAESIKRGILINPITITTQMVLVAGARRLAAYKLLGRAMIPAQVVTMDDVDAEITEIEENIEREQLTELEESEQLARLKELYEAKFPETRSIRKTGGPGRPGLPKAPGVPKPPETSAKIALVSGGLGNIDSGGCEKAPVPTSFAESASKKTGYSPRAIQDKVQTAKNLTEEAKEAVRGTPLEDSQTDLRELAATPKDQQNAVAKAALEAAGSNGKPSVKQARAKLGVGTRRKPKPKPPPVAGKSRVNGELVDDPPEIAELRAQGRIAPGVVPEITQQDGATVEGVTEEINEEQARTDDALSDRDWLKALPLHSQLSGACLKTFCEDALAYRALEGPRKSFAWHVSRAFNKCRRKGPYVWRLKQFLGMNHPRMWIRCPAVKDGGCGGSGASPMTGECPRCHGAGYWING